MKLRVETLLVTVALWVLPAFASAAPAPCKYWNTLSFFISADSGDVAHCLKTKNANASDVAGLTPMHHAAGFGRNPVLVNILAKSGAKPNALDAKKMTPLHMAVSFNRNPAVITALIAVGADTEARERRTWTPLHLASAFGNKPAVIRALVKGGGKLEARTGVGRTALHLAALKGLFPTVALLIKLGAKVYARDIYGRTPLHLAAQASSPAVVRALVRAKAKINAGDTRGEWTPFHLAAWYGKNLAVAKALFEMGADKQVKDKFGRTPFYYTKYNENLKESVDYFKPRK